MLLARLDLLSHVHDPVMPRESLDVVRRHVTQQRRLTHAISSDQTVLVDCWVWVWEGYFFG